MQSGQHNPVLVVLNGEEYVLIDGYRRVSALKSLGKDTVEATVLPQSESEALLFSHGLAHTRRRSALEEGWFLFELQEHYNLNQLELATRLDRSISWISRRLGLVVSLPASVQELVRTGKLCAYGAMKYLLPLARAKRSDCEELTTKIASTGMSSRQLEKVYKGWKRGTKETRSKIISKPYLYLQTLSAPDDQPKEHSRIISKLILVGKLLGQVNQELSTEILHNNVLNDPDELHRVWQLLDKTYLTLQTKLKEHLDDRP